MQVPALRVSHDCAPISEFTPFGMIYEPRLVGFHFSLNLTAIKFLRLLVIQDLDLSYGIGCFKGIPVLYGAASYGVLHDLLFWKVFVGFLEL